MFPNFDDNRKDDDFLDEIRQKINDESNLNFEEKKNEINRSKNAFLGAVSGIALSAVVGWFALSPRYETVSDAEIPVVRRPQTAIKVQPADPGGMEINNQDKTIYNIIDKTGTQAPVVENLLPPPEEPKLPEIPVVANNTISTEPSNIPDIAPVVETAEKVITKANEPVAVKEPAPEEKVISIKEAAQKTPQPQIVAENKATAPEVKEVKSVEKAEPKRQAVNIKIDAPSPEPAKEISNTSAPKGSWQIQLIASPNLDAVKNSWKSLSQKYTVLSGQPHEIETADLGAKGLFYRLKAGSFKDRAGADKLCNDIKALGGSCIVKKK